MRNKFFGLVLALALGLFLFGCTSSNNPPPNDNQNDSNDMNYFGSGDNQNQPNPNPGAGNGYVPPVQNEVPLDCSGLVTLDALKSSLGVSSQTTMEVKNSNSTSCGISWLDSSANEVLGTSPNSSGQIIVIKSVGANAAAEAQTGVNIVCRGKASLNIGDASCLPSGSGGRIVFAKNGFAVQIISIGPGTKANGVLALANVVAGNIMADQ